MGDANNDGQVTGLDLVMVQQNFGAIGDANGLLLGDTNDDGQVTGLDLVIAQQHFGVTLAMNPVTAPVPEPASGMLLLALWIIRSCRVRGTMQ